MALLVFPAVAAGPNDGVEARVREVFASAPVMVSVAKCESGIRQFKADGTVLMGGAGGQYVGIFQISDRVHRAYALSLGMDIDTVEGNIAYAVRLFNASGTRPWVSCVPAGQGMAAPAQPIVIPSAAAVPAAAPAPASTDAAFTPVPLAAPLPEPSTAPAPAPAQTVPAAQLPAANFTVNTQFGMSHAQIRDLQKVLNAMGYTVAASGPGSAGNETSLFGSLTRVAVRKFQCEKLQVCAGSESTNGYGRVGPKTRAALNQLTAR